MTDNIKMVSPNVDRSLKIILFIFTSIIVVTATIMAVFVGKVLPKKYLQIPSERDTGEPYIIPIHKLPKDCDTYGWRMLPMLPEKPKKRTKRHPNYFDLKQHSYVISISRRLHVDIEDLSFSCLGVAISKTLVLTGHGCEEAVKDFSAAIIRSESNYFSIGGVTHGVVKVFKSPLNYPYSELLVVQVKPPFSRKVSPADLPFGNVHNGSLENLVSFGMGDTWNAKMAKSKYERIHVEYWTLDRNVCKNTADCEIVHESQNECCARGALDSCNWLKKGDLSLNGRPLVNGKNYIMGMAFDYSERNANSSNRTTIFLTFRHLPFLEWIYDVIYKNTFK